LAAALDQLRRRLGSLALGHPELGRRDIVHQQQVAIFVLHRDTGRQEHKRVLQSVQFCLDRAGAVALRGGNPQFVDYLTPHGRGLWAVPS